MKRCPITYEPLKADEQYSLKGLKQFSRSLTHLESLPYTAGEQVREASQRSTKMSIQGVQPKLSAVFDAKKANDERLFANHSDKVRGDN